MKRTKTKSVPIDESRLEPSDALDLDLRADVLTDLLKLNRELSNILNPDELYASFAGLIKDKFSLQNLALFVYQDISETFDLVYSQGQGQLDSHYRSVLYGGRRTTDFPSGTSGQ